MPLILASAEFLPNDLPLVKDFDCGGHDWETEMADWIRLPPTRKFGNANYDTDIWLYFHPDGRVVGFGSLGTTRWKFPVPNGIRTQFSIIPALAIKSEFQRQPRSQRDGQKFSHQILGDLLGKALGHQTQFAGLFVHQLNTHAIRLYKKFGFKELPGIENGYRRMYRRLR
jgi:ribosomal protein S18 acetylase RimI-like enzyme